MAISTMDGVVAGLVNSRIIPYYKAAFSSKGAGYYHSLFRVAGEPGAANAPSTGVGNVCTNATLGALPTVNAGGANSLYLGRASLNSATVGHFMLYDRLVETSGLSGTATTAQDINSTALTRYVTGDGCRLFIEWQTATGASQVNITVVYTNQAGTGNRSVTIPFMTSPNIGQMMPIPLLAGDTGIRSVQNITLSGTTGTLGNFGITIVKPLVDFPISVANTGIFFDAIAVGLPKIEANACLAWMALCSISSQGNVIGQLNFIEG